MSESFSQAIQDYLKAIYELTRQGERVTTNVLAERMKVTPASVTGMVQKLSRTQPPLVHYLKHRGVVLTPAGEKAALEVLRHHRLLEMFLHQMLGYAWDEVHTEADQLEHVISRRFADRIASAMGNPQQDPHGDPIPSQDLEMPESQAISLSELRAGQRAIVQRVADQNPHLLRYLGSLGLVPNARLEVLDYTPFDQNLRLRIEDCEEHPVLGPAVTREIWVRLIG